MFLFIAPALAFLAFLLLLLVTLSVPITHTIYLFKLTADISINVVDTSVRTVVKFGVWGYCTSGLDVAALGLSANAEPPTCSPRRLGYNFDQTVQNTLQQSGTNPSTISKGLTIVLVLHPIACALTFIYFLTTLYLLYRRHPTMHARTIPLSILSIGITTSLLSTIVFLIDVILVAVVRHSINKDSDGVIGLDWGNAVWLALVASVLLWVAEVCACLGVFVGRRKRRAGRY